MSNQPPLSKIENLTGKYVTDFLPQLPAVLAKQGQDPSSWANECPGLDDPRLGNSRSESDIDLVASRFVGACCSVSVTYKDGIRAEVGWTEVSLDGTPNDEAVPSMMCVRYFAETAKAHERFMGRAPAVALCFDREVLPGLTQALEHLALGEYYDGLRLAMEYPEAEWPLHILTVAEARAGGPCECL